MIPDDIQPGETITADFLNRIKNRADPSHYQDKPTQVFKYRISSVGMGKLMYWNGSDYDVDPSAQEEELFGASEIEVGEEVHVLFSRGSGKLEVISGSSSGGGSPCGICGPRINAGLVTLSDGTKVAEIYVTSDFDDLFGVDGVVFAYDSDDTFTTDDITFECS